MSDAYATQVLGRFAARMRSRREELGLSLAALAKRSGLNRQTLHRIERARAPGVTVASAATLADALGLPLSVLLNGEASVSAKEMRLVLAAREIFGTGALQ